MIRLCLSLMFFSQLSFAESKTNSFKAVLELSEAMDSLKKTGIQKNYCIKDHILEEGENKPYCHDLQIGEKRILNSGDYKSYTTAAQKYSLKKVDQNRYILGFNPFFYRKAIGAQDPQNDKGNILEGDNVKEKYDSIRSLAVYNKIEKCLQYTSRFVANKDRTLKFEINFDDEAPVIPIELTEMKGYRSDVVRFEKNISCGKILHEFLHYTGLIDEYADEEFPKREVLNEPNIMGEYQPLKSFSIKCSSALPRKEGIHLDRVVGSTRFYSIKISNSKESLKGIIEVLSRKDSLCDMESIANKFPDELPKEIGLLNNEQINSIIYSQCKEKNEKYYKHAQKAY